MRKSSRFWFMLILHSLWSCSQISVDKTPQKKNEPNDRNFCCLLHCNFRKRSRMRARACVCIKMEYKDIFNLNLWLFLAGRRTITILAHINRVAYQYDAFDSSMTPFSHYRSTFIYIYRHIAFIGTLGASLTASELVVVVSKSSSLLLWQKRFLVVNHSNGNFVFSENREDRTKLI